MYLRNVTGVQNYEIQVCIYNPYFEQMVGQIYPNELQFNKANSPDAEAPCLDLNLSITNGIVSSKIYDKRDDFNFEIVKFPFLMEMFLACSPSIGVYVQRKVRIGTIPELYLRIVSFAEFLLRTNYHTCHKTLTLYASTDVPAHLISVLPFRSGRSKENS